jgi:hypothetical protein
MKNENIMCGDNFQRNKKLRRIVIIVTTSKEPLIDCGEPPHIVWPPVELPKSDFSFL